VFRPQGLVTLSPASSLRARVGRVSCRQRSWDSPFEAFPSPEVSKASPPGSTHMPFFLPYPPTPMATTRSGKLRLLGFDPRESPLQARRAVNAPTAGCSPGFFPFQGTPASCLARDFARTPLTCFAESFASERLSRHLRVSIGPRLALPATAGEPAILGEPTLLGFSHRPVP
jgi:hypothetical protein